MGIEEVHSHRIIHMDIKPENFVFVNGTLKLIDLGLSLCLPEGVDHLETEVVYGTNLFMAPECFTSRLAPREGGVKPRYITTLTLQADIWSLGVLLLQMLPVKGDRPPPNMPIDYIRNKLLWEEEKLSGIPDVLKLCLQKDPGNRPNVAGLRNALF